MQFERKILKALRERVDTPEIVVVTGMRRVGKTTALRIIHDEIPSRNKAFIDIENPIDQRIFEEKDFNNIWANLQAYGISAREKAYLFLDEIQAMPDIVKAVKYLYDHAADGAASPPRVKFFLTGSSSYYLKNLFPESLAGRKRIFELNPLDFEEFLIFKGQSRPFSETLAAKERDKNAVRFEKERKLYDEYLAWGGFPQVALADNPRDKAAQLNDIIKSYFEKDVRLISDFRQINQFRDLLLLLLKRTGSRLDVTKLASEASLSRDTVYSYLAFLQGTYVIDLIPPYTLNRDREISGAKKVYVCDNGFLNYFGKINDGALLENAVYLNLRQYGEVRYYQRRTGRELDFILPGMQAGVEVKQTGDAHDVRRVAALGQSLKLREQYVVTREFRDLPGLILAQDL
jgi:predicted AAA+ superfamily ATPase